MTLGPLGRRLFAAFLVVALSSVAVLSVAALIGAGRGLSAARQAERERAAERCATAVGTAYRAAGGWPGTDLRPAQVIAAGAGADLVVLDRDGDVVTGTVGSGRGSPGMGQGMGSGMGSAMGHGWVSSPVVVAGRQVGTVRLRFGTPGTTTGTRVAWGWITVAAVVALTGSLAMSWFVTRRLIRPVRQVTRTAHAIAAGDRAARSGVRAPGELGELACAFDGMADEVSRTERARRHLAADVAHELRTPLTALRAGLEELRDGLAEPEPARMAALHDQALRLARVIDDLGELAAAESAAVSLRMREVDLGELARSALLAREPELRAAGIEVRTDLSSVVVRADPDRLHQALGNLLANAARYCRPGDTVRVGVRRVDGTAVAEVADTGPGITAADLPHVFDRLWRGRGSTAVSGSGIGLAVVRELVTAHGGTVTATSTPPTGATFTIRLPIPGGPPISPSQPHGKDGRPSPRRTSRRGTAAARRRPR